MSPSIDVPREALRQSHIGITLNDRSSPMEKRMEKALNEVIRRVERENAVRVIWEKRLLLSEVVSKLNAAFGNYGKFTKATSIETWLKPDGGFLWVADRQGSRRCILVAEAKRQGTNSVRAEEGKAPQAKGNAIERLRKNMEGVDALFCAEEITPFVCFGEGCDFARTSSILDRVATMNGFFPLNVIHFRKLYFDSPVRDVLKPSSLFFREEPWSPQEMVTTMGRVAQAAVDHYEEKYGLLRA